MAWRLLQFHGEEIATGMNLSSCQIFRVIYNRYSLVPIVRGIWKIATVP